MSEVCTIKQSSLINSRGGRSQGKMSQIKPLASQVLEIVNHFLHTAQNGFLILTIQDSCVVKIEKTEKFIITTKNREAEYIKYDKPLRNHPLQAKIVAELQEIEYGQLVIRLGNGQVEQIEKTEKRRVSEMDGINGDGI